jgi:hypothetical protein
MPYSIIDLSSATHPLQSVGKKQRSREALLGTHLDFCKYNLRHTR